MRNEWTMRLFSRQHLDPDSAREQLRAFASIAGGIFKPDKWGLFEPVRRLFSLDELDGPADSLVKPLGSVLFLQGKPKKMEGSVYNRAFPPGSPFPNPIFLTYWQFNFDQSWIGRTSWDLLIEAFHELFQVTKADFGALTTLEEYGQRHTTPARPSYRNGAPDFGMPGLYRFNLFSSGLAGWLRLDELPTNLAIPYAMDDGAVELVLGGTSQESTIETAVTLQETVIDWVGREKFFDIQDPDRTLCGPPWDKVPSVPWEPMSE